MVAKISVAQRAVFKELARSIVVEDRNARKYGRSQNTIGAIERALVRAFLEGRQDDPVEKPADEIPTFVNWIEIPPRGRDALWTMSVAISGCKHDNARFSVELEKLGDERPRWHRVSDQYPETGFSNGAIIPLLRLGLFEYSDESRSTIRMTSLGVATCVEFWRRWNSTDETLPVMSMRP